MVSICFFEMLKYRKTTIFSLKMDLRGDNVGCLKLTENAYKGRNKRIGRKNKGVIDYQKMAEELEKHQN